MLVYNSRLIGTTILSVQAGGPIGQVSSLIIDPDNLQVIAFRLEGSAIDRRQNILDARSVREYSDYGMVIDDAEELVAPSDVIKIEQVIELNFNLLSLKVETKKGSKLGHIIDFTVNSDDFIIQQILVKRPLVKRLIDPELLISRKEIVEVTDYKIIVKDEEKVLKARAAKEDFVPNFVNPFRTQGQELSSADTENED